MTLHWPPVLACAEAAAPELSASPAATNRPSGGPVLTAATGLTDPRLIRGIAEITETMAQQLDDDAATANVMPTIRAASRRWLELQVRSGLLPASAGGALDDLARAVHDQRYELGPVTAYLRDPQVENIDINGFNQHWA